MVIAGTDLVVSRLFAVNQHLEYLPSYVLPINKYVRIETFFKWFPNINNGLRSNLNNRVKVRNPALENFSNIDGFCDGKSHSLQDNVCVLLLLQIEQL